MRVLFQIPQVMFGIDNIAWFKLAQVMSISKTGRRNAMKNHQELGNLRSANIVSDRKLHVRSQSTSFLHSFDGSPFFGRVQLPQDAAAWLLFAWLRSELLVVSPCLDG